MEKVTRGAAQVRWQKRWVAEKVRGRKGEVAEKVRGGKGGKGRKKPERVICLSVPRAPPTPRCFASTLAVPRGLKRGEIEGYG